ncbi:MAG: hypothetical protein AAF489_09570 [Bacteroidota bacterium]
MSKISYNPSSHFYIDHSNLILPVSGDYGTDAFGPVDGDPSNKFRTTSVVRTSATSKVLAICDGQLLIQPFTGDNNKVNLILKPSASYAPFKIKYFIYRGVNKAHILSGANVAPQTSETPEFIQRVWEAHINLYESIDQPLPTFLSADYIGFDPDNQPAGDLIDEVFFGTASLDFNAYNIPRCIKGESIGTFTGQIGLDIVLDHGDYAPQFEEQLFKLDLEYARKAEHVFDLSTVTGAVKQKRYREHIQQFVDAAAFWGSHIDNGSITLYNDPNSKSSVDEIYPLVENYQTKDKLYVYIQSERERSYNYYGNNGQISFDVQGTSPSVLVDYEHESWPILVKDIPPGPTDIKELQFSFEYNIDAAIDAEVINVACYCRFPNWTQDNLIKTSHLVKTTAPPPPVGDKPDVVTRTGQSKLVENIPVRMKDISSVFHPVANFYSIYTMGNQTPASFDLHEDLWKSDLSDIFAVPSPSNDQVTWSVSTRNSLMDLSEIGYKSSLNGTKMITDFGEDSSGNVEERNLFVSVLADIDEKNRALLPKSIASGFQKNVTKDNYGTIIYDDVDFRLYKGNIDDGTVFPGLHLVHEKVYAQKKAYLQLGILKKERNRILYDSEVIPDTTDPSYVPFILDPAQVFFFLEEDTSIAPAKGFRKFRLGVKYEDDTGVINTKFPTTDVFVYTYDNLLYSSRAFAEHQKFSEEFPKCKVDFRTKAPFAGEFGFDWMRKGDTGLPGDVDYETNVGKLYSDPAHTIVIDNVNTYSGHFNVIPSMYKRLELEYDPFPTQFDSSNNIAKYYAPKLVIYPLYVAPAPPIPDLDRQAIFTAPYDDVVNRIASLTLHIEITDEPVRLELDYDASKLVVGPSPVVIPKTVGSHTLDITVRSVGGFGTDKEIAVKAFYNDASGNLDPIGKKVGVLRVAANDKASRASKKVVLVTVKTNINGTDMVPSANDKALFLKKYLRQMLITPVIDDIELDMRTNVTFNADYVHLHGGTNKLISWDDTNPTLTRLYTFLQNQNVPGTSTSIDTTYPDSFRLFFFEESGGYIDSSGAYAGLNGLSSGKNILTFVTANDATGTHEFSHSAELPHSFSAYEASKYATFTHKPRTTENIQDYSHQASPPIDRILLWDWQARVAFVHSDVEP